MRQQWPDLTQRLRTVPSDRAGRQPGRLLDAVREAMCANQGYRSDSLDAVGPRGSVDDGRPDEISQCENRLMLAGCGASFSRGAPAAGAALL